MRPYEYSLHTFGLKCNTNRAKPYKKAGEKEAEKKEEVSLGKLHKNCVSHA